MAPRRQGASIAVGGACVCGSAMRGARRRDVFARSGRVLEALGREKKREQTIGRSAGADGAIGLNTKR